MSVKKCEWTMDDDGVYITDCGNAFVFTDDGPIEHKFKLCPYCGRELKAVKFTES